MRDRLCVVLGATGAVGSIIVAALQRESSVKAVTFGRTPIEGVDNFNWRFGEVPPFSELMQAHPGIDSVTVFFAAIAWPQSAVDVERNLAALGDVIKQIPAGARLVALSSCIAATRAESYYGDLKRRSEALVASARGVNLRLGIVDSRRPGGQVLFFRNLACLLRVVPVIQSGAPVFDSDQKDIEETVLRLSPSADEHASDDIVVVNSWVGTLIDALRRVVGRHCSWFVCIPVPE